VVCIVVIVSTELHEQPAATLTLLGLRESDGPDGVLAAERVSVPEKPPRLLTIMLEVVEEPPATDKSLGLAEIEKSAAGSTETNPRGADL
jgi:hypothetical protein